jgi:hypothetical protein
MGTEIQTNLYTKLQQQFHSTLRSLSRKEGLENEEVKKNKKDDSYHEVRIRVRKTRD